MKRPRKLKFDPLSGKFSYTITKSLRISSIFQRNGVHLSDLDNEIFLTFKVGLKLCAVSSQSTHNLKIGLFAYLAAFQRELITFKTSTSAPPRVKVTLI